MIGFELVEGFGGKRKFQVQDEDEDTEFTQDHDKTNMPQPKQ